MSKTADKILEQLIEDFSENHSNIICAIVKKKGKCDGLSKMIIDAFIKKIGKEKVMSILGSKIKT